MLGVIVLIGCIIAEFHPRTHFDIVGKHLLFAAALGAAGWAWNWFSGNEHMVVVNYALCYSALITLMIWLPFKDYIDHAYMVKR